MTKPTISPDLETRAREAAAAAMSVEAIEPRVALWLHSLSGGRRPMDFHETVGDAAEDREHFLPILTDILASFAQGEREAGRMEGYEARRKETAHREPTREEMDAALGDKAECFFDGRTVRRCRHCRRPVAGGPTACEPCVLRQQGREEAMAEAKKAVGTSADAFAYDRASAALRLEDDALVLYVPKAQRHRVTYSDVLLCPGSAKDERETLAHITEVLAFVIFDAMQQADRAAREEMVTQAKVPATGARTIPVLNLYVLTEAVFDAVRTSPSEAVRAKARNALVDALAPHIAAVHEAALADAQRDHEAALAKAKEDGAREALVAMLDRFNEGCGAAFARTGQKAMLDAAWDLHQCALGVARAEERQEVIGQIKASNERLGERMGTMLGELSDLERRTGHLRAEVQATEHQRFALWDVVKGLEAQDGDG